MTTNAGGVLGPHEDILNHYEWFAAELTIGASGKGVSRRKPEARNMEMNDEVGEGSETSHS